jgi:TetR/AcrR family transcriptional regulator
MLKRPKAKSAKKPVSQPRRRTRDPEASREALLRAATELFALHGYDGVRVAALARRAGVNKALISYYFGGKRPLYRAAIESSFRELHGLAEELRDRSRAPDVLIGRFIEGFAELAQQRRPHFPALFLRETLSTGELAPEAVEHVASILTAFRDVLRRGDRQGVFRPMDPAQVYIHLVGSLAFFFATQPARGRLAAKHKLPAVSPSPEDYVAFVRDAASRVLTARPGVPK